MKSIAIFAAFFVLALATPAHAGTAVCKNAKGRAFGQGGPERHGESVDALDGLKGVTFVISWEQRSASVVTADERFNRNLKHEATLVSQTPERITLTAVDSNVVWLYTVFPKERVVLVSSHDGDASSHSNGGAIATAMLASCTISE